MNKKHNIKAVDFFCSGGGMSYGLTKAGIEIIAGIDIDLNCKETFEANIPSAKFIHADVKKLRTADLLKYVNIKKNDDNMIFIGCNPCQFWTHINTNKTKSQQTMNLLSDFKRFVHYYNPGYVIVENVPGILKKKEESGLGRFVSGLERKGYKVEYKIVNMNYYGVPQNRKRFSLIATRVNDKPIFPKPIKSRQAVVKYFIGVQNGFKRINAGVIDETNFKHTTARLSEKNLMRIKSTPKNGGTRLAWADSKLQLDTYKNRNKYSFRDVYGRMSWERPAPTITTRFNSLSNGRFGHPEENRAISLREGATLQTFPKRFVFKTKSVTATAIIIGNAVPPEYAKRIGKTIIGVYKNDRSI